MDDQANLAADIEAAKQRAAAATPGSVAIPGTDAVARSPSGMVGVGASGEVLWPSQAAAPEPPTIEQRYREVPAGEESYCDGVCAYRHKVGWRELRCVVCGAPFMGNKGKRCPACRRR